MADVQPFRALRPNRAWAGRVIAPPYDVLSENEARAIASERGSFIRVTRSEVDLPAGTDPHADVAYRKARENLDRFVADGVLVQDEAPRFYLYGQRMGSHDQIGVLAGCSVAEYDDGRIAKHEYTRPDKEDDRTHHMDVLNAQVGLVFLAHRHSGAVSAIVAEVRGQDPEWAVTTADEVLHRLWVVPESLTAPLAAAFAEIPRLYIADGHHRSAAASRIHAKRRNQSTAYFLAGLFPADQLQVMAYNRVVHDLLGMTPAAFRERLGEAFVLQADGQDAPPRRGTFAMYLEGRWTTLVPKADPPNDDPVAALDVSVLQDRVLGPLLGIEDPRRSDRITFVGGIRGPQALVDAVDRGQGAVAFHLFPTSLHELFDVADANAVMPPKSTWFEPKLREGVVVRRLE